MTGVTVPDRQYDGTKVAVLDVENAVLTGMVPGDEDITVVSGTGKFADPNVGTNKDVSNPQFVLSGTNSKNYTVKCEEELSGNILRRELTVENIFAADKQYDTTADVLEDDLDLSKAELVGVVKDEVVTLNTDNVSAKYVDEDDQPDPSIGDNKKVLVTGLTLDGDQDVLKNYTLVEPIYAAVPYRITARNAQFVKVDGEAIVSEKVYDGNTTAEVDVTKLKLVDEDGEDIAEEVTIDPNGYVARYDSADAGEKTKTVKISYLQDRKSVV